MGDQIVEKVTWYIKYRTMIWGAVWFVVGLAGGNADRIKERIPTLQYNNQEINSQAEEYNQLKIRLENLEKSLTEEEEKGIIR